MPKPVYKHRNVEVEYAATRARIAWRRSSRGNLWARVMDEDGSEVTVTIFWQEDDGWKVCIAGREKRIRYHPIAAEDEDEAVQVVESALEEFIGYGY